MLLSRQSLISFRAIGSSVQFHHNGDFIPPPRKDSFFEDGLTCGIVCVIKVRVVQKNRGSQSVSDSAGIDLVSLNTAALRILPSQLASVRAFCIRRLV